MNIWLINHHASKKGRHVNLALELYKLGHNVTIFSASFKHNLYKEMKEYPPGVNWLIEDEQDFVRIWIKTPPYYGNGIKRFINQMVFTLRSVKTGLKLDKPDVIIGSSVHLLAGVAGYYLARKMNLPFVFEVRDLWPQTLIDLGALKEKSPVTFFFKKIEEFLYKKADKIISVLPLGVNYITALGVDKEKIIHIPNGANLRWFDKCKENDIDNEELGNVFLENQAKTIFTYTGSFGIANGLQTVVEAAKIIQKKNIENVHFLLVGAGPEKDKLIKKAEKWKLENITFGERVKKDLIPWILVQSDCCIFHLKDTPVFKYGISSNKIFDYLASGNPMISAVNTPNDFSEIADCGFSIPPENPEMLAEAVINISNMAEEKKREWGTNGRKYVEANHDYSILARKLETLLDSLI